MLTHGCWRTDGACNPRFPCARRPTRFKAFRIAAVVRLSRCPGGLFIFAAFF